MIRPEPRANFKQGADDLAERARKPEIAYTSTRIRPLSLAPGPVGCLRKSNSPNSNLLRQGNKQNNAIKTIIDIIYFIKCLKQNDCSFTWPRGPHTNTQTKKGLAPSSLQA
jgi:hypothetical protein